MERSTKQDDKGLELMLEALGIDATDRDTLQHALQELQVHQVELEQQNQELKETQQALEQSRDRYAALYDFAPVGYVTLDSQGIIHNINLTGAALLGQERGRLIGQPFAHRLVRGSSDELFSFLRRAYASEGQVEGEINLASTNTVGGRKIRLDGKIVVNLQGKPRCFTSLIDFTEYRYMERDLRESHAELNSILSVAPVGIGLVRNRIFQWLNPRFLEMVGYSEKELIGFISRMVFPDDREFERIGKEQHAQIAETGVSEVETRMQHKDGGILDILLRSTFLDRDDASATIFTALDITDRKQAEERLHLARSVLKHAPEGMIVTDCELRIIEINPAFSIITGYSEAEALGRRPDMLKSGRHDETFYKTMWEQLLTQGKWEGEIWNRRKSGEIFPEWLTITAIRDPLGNVTNYAGIFTDITNQAHLRERLHQLAYYDPLTKLPNRELFRDRFETLVHQARRHRQLLALLFLDLDNFKHVNDTQGHLVGDQLLKDVVVRLRNCVRETDAVARLGGDEFTILISELEYPHDAEAVAEKIQQLLAAPFVLNGVEFYITVSIGISVFPNDSDDIDTLIKHADTAMYSAKRAGRGTHRFYLAELSAQNQERMATVNHLRRAVENGQIHVHYQPQMSLRTGRIHGVEALARWKHPQIGEISPTRFITVAEETGQIIALSEWIVQQAFDDWKEHLADLYNDQMPCLSVNVSSVQFQQQDLYAFFSGMLDRSGMQPCQLEVELTETVLVQDAKKAEKVLADLDQLGIHIAIDDFGTGYSSFNYLAQFPIHTIKIDRSFIQHLMSGAKQTFLVSAIINMSRTMDFDVVAEGVETTGQLALLNELGCDLAQGYLISRPMNATDIVNWMQQRGVASHRRSNLPSPVQ